MYQDDNVSAIVEKKKVNINIDEEVLFTIYCKKKNNNNIEIFTTYCANKNTIFFAQYSERGK